MWPICAASADKARSVIGCHPLRPKPIAEMQTDSIVAKYTILRLKARGLPIPIGDSKESLKIAELYSVSADICPHRLQNAEL